MGPFAPLLATLILGAASQPAAAPDPAQDPIKLQWTGPADCPAAQAIRARVRTDSDALPVTADAVVTQDEEGGWTLALRIEGSAGLDTRTLRGESCEALADAAALLIGVAAAPKSDEPAPSEAPAKAELPPEPSPQPESQPDTTPQAPRPSPRPRPEAATGQEPRAALDLGVHARASALLQLGPLLPGNVTGGAELALGIDIPWVRVEARGSYLGQRRVVDNDTATVGADVDGWSVGASGCGRWDGSNARLFVPLCLGAQLGRARARAFGLEQDGVGRGLWAHAVIDAGLGVRLAPRWALVAAAEAVVSLRRPAFRVRDSPILFQPSAAAGRLVVGVEFALRS